MAVLLQLLGRMLAVAEHLATIAFVVCLSEALSGDCWEQAD